MSAPLVLSVAACHWSELLASRCSTHTCDLEPSPSSASSPKVPASLSGGAKPVLERDIIAIAAAPSGWPSHLRFTPPQHRQRRQSLVAVCSSRATSLVKLDEAPNRTHSGAYAPPERTTHTIVSNRCKRDQRDRRCCTICTAAIAPVTRMGVVPAPSCSIAPLQARLPEGSDVCREPVRGCFRGL